jgi:hypothetical protein
MNSTTEIIRRVRVAPCTAQGSRHRIGSSRTACYTASTSKATEPAALNGWYLLHLDGRAAGAFGSWKSGTRVLEVVR